MSRGTAQSESPAYVLRSIGYSFDVNNLQLYFSHPLLLVRLKQIYIFLCLWLVGLSTSFAQSATFSALSGFWDRAQGGMVINWSTSQETRNRFFDVQRSYDLITFATIVEIASKGSGVSNRDYTFVDVNSSQTGQMYYRIRAVDLDGKPESTTTLPLFRDPDSNPFVIYDDQIGDVVYLGLPGSAQPRAVRIINQRGIPLIQQELIRDLVVVKPLPVGLYIMEVTTNTGEVLRKRYLKPR